MRTCAKCGTPAFTQRETCAACGEAFDSGGPQQVVPAPGAANGVAAPHVRMAKTDPDTDGVDTIVGLFGALAIIVGALLRWLGPVNAVRVPVLFLFDSHTRARNPGIGHFLIVLGFLGILLAFVRGAEGARVAIGSLALGAVILYSAQVSSQLHGVRMYFDQFVGWGPWLTMFGAVALIASGLRAEVLGNRWATAAAVSAVLVAGTWALVMFGFNNGGLHTHAANVIVHVARTLTLRS